jgi:hypothetical protein
MRDEATGVSRQLEVKELHFFNSSLTAIRMTKSRRMRWVGNVAGREEEECVHDIGGEARNKRQLGRQRRRWMNNIKVILER